MSKPRSRKSPAEEAPDIPPHWGEYFGLRAGANALSQLAQRDRLPPVLLFYGRPGVGKRALAAQTAAMLWCETRDGCGRCDSCRWVRAGEQTDLLWVDPVEATIPITIAATVQEHLETRGQSGSARVVVICNIERLTTQAANRLLKTLEEPPDGAHLILTTDRRRSLLPTVLSRCVPWQVQPPAPAETLAWLRQKCADEGLAPASSEIEWHDILRRGGLAPGPCLHWARVWQDRPAKIWQSGTEPGEILAHAERVVPRGRGGATASELVRMWEMDLNEVYRQNLGRSPTTPAAAMRARRSLLQKLKQLAGRGRIALNSQLAAEALLLRSHGQAGDDGLT